MNLTLLNKAKAIIAERLAVSNERSLQAKTNLLLDPKYNALDLEKRKLTLLISSAFAEEKDATTLLNKYEIINTKLKNMRNQLKIDSSLHFCKICNDLGVLANGNYCNCLKNAYNNLLRVSCGMENLPTFKFSNNNLENIACNQKEKLNSTYTELQEYCDKFPFNTHNNVFILGEVGVGKSCLVSAVANELIAKNFNVQYFTTFAFNNLLLKYHTTDANDRMQYMDNLLTCDLLIIDDLGTEPLLKNVTLEYLHSILDARQRKPTIVTSNLTPQDLLNKYGEKIFSRLTNKTFTKVIGIKGTDLRTIK